MSFPSGSILAIAVLLLAQSASAASSQRLYAASVSGDALLGLDAAGAVVETVALAGTLDAPRGIAFGPDGRLYATSGDRVLVFDGTGALADELGEGTGLQAPRGLAFGPRGRMYVTSTNRVLELTVDGQLTGVIGEELNLQVPAGIAVRADGHLFVASAGSNVVHEFDAAGRFVRNFGPGSSLSIPIGLAFGPGGILYATSFFNGRIIGFDQDGAQVANIAPTGLLLPTGLAFGPNGHLYAASSVTNQVLEVDFDGNVLGTLDAGGALLFPEGLAFRPQRFQATIAGNLARAGTQTKKLKEKAVLSIAPGSGILMLALVDDAANASDLASVFGASALVFHGLEAFANASSKQRTLQGNEFAAPAATDGISALLLGATGKLKDFGGGSAFDVTKASGPFFRGAGQRVFKGTVKSGKALK